MLTSMERNSIKIYGVPLSVHTRKVILAARIKAIPHEVVPVAPVDPASLPAGWRDLSPTGLIPVIDHGGYVLADSTAILLYLERGTPEPALLPSEVKAYGAALALDAWAGSELFRHVMHPLFHQQVVNPRIRKLPSDRAAIDAALHIAAPEAFAYLERMVTGAFLVGSRLSIADLAVVSNLLLFYYLGYRIDQARFPRLAGYFQEHLAAPVLGAALEAEKPFAASMELDTAFLS